jgi:hypothetical protein
MSENQPLLLDAIDRQTEALGDLIVHGEDVYQRMRARLPRRATDSQILPALFVRHAVQQLAAAHHLAVHAMLPAAAAHGRSLFEALVNVKYLDQDDSGERHAAYIAYCIAVSEVEAEALLPGTPSAKARMHHWTAAVGLLRATDTEALARDMRAARRIERSALVSAYLVKYRAALEGKLGRVDWGTEVGHGSVLERAKALPDAEHLEGLYRLVYKFLSHEAHGLHVLDGLERSDDGLPSLLDPATEPLTKRAAVADAVTGLGLSLLTHAADTHLPGNPDLASKARQILEKKAWEWRSRSRRPGS